MTESHARVVLLIRAIEESDPDGRLLPEGERQRAARQAWSNVEQNQLEADAGDPWTRPMGSVEEEFLWRRAVRLREELTRHRPVIQRALSLVRWPRWSSLAAVGGALLLGAVLNELGSGRRINLLSFPLLGVFAWNLAVYLLVILAGVRSVWAGSRESGEPGWREGWWWRWVIQGLRRCLPDNARREWPELAGGLERFGHDWLRLGAPLHWARVRRTLHAAAVALVCGLVAGMYWRGLAFEYVAGWESTFLDAAGLSHLLHLVLGPASWLTGIPLPGVSELAGIGGPNASVVQRAAPWIHLYAATAGLYVVVPRLLLAALDAWEVRRLKHRFPVNWDEPYFRRLVVVGEGGGGRAEVIPYRHALGSRAKELLRALGSDLWGGKTQVVFLPPIEYGSEEESVREFGERDARLPDYVVLVFNLASTPEEESQGCLMNQWKQFVAEGKGARQLLLLVDEAGYRRRLEGQAGFEGRLEERRSIWQEAAAAQGLELTTLSLEETPDEPTREALRQAVWSASTGGGTT